MLPSVFALSAIAAVAVVLTRTRAISADVDARRAAARCLALAAAVQGAHFAEEAATGLHRELPALLGASEVPFAAFLLINLTWLAAWVASIPGLRSGRPIAYFAAWFLALAGAFNGIVHPVLAFAADGYFPGLATSPLVGIAGAALWIRLGRATAVAIRPA